MIEQLDIFGAIAQVEAEATAQPKPPEPEFRVGDRVRHKRGSIHGGEMLGTIAGFDLRSGSSRPTVLWDGRETPVTFAYPENMEVIPQQVEAPQPEPAPEPEFTDSNGKPLKVGDRIVYSITLSRKKDGETITETRTLRGTIEGFEDKYWTAPVALVRVAAQGPLYPCGLRAVTLEGDRDGR